jgi:hypothetical protein
MNRKTNKKENSGKNSKDAQQDQALEEKLIYPKRPKRVELSREEVLKRMADFPKRAPKIIAAIRRAREEGYDRQRGVSQMAVPDFGNKTVSLYYTNGQGTTCVTLEKPRWETIAERLFLVGRLVASTGEFPPSHVLEAGVAWDSVVHFNCK